MWAERVIVTLGRHPHPTPATLPFLKHTNSTDFPLIRDLRIRAPLMKCYTRCREQEHKCFSAAAWSFLSAVWLQLIDQKMRFEPQRRVINHFFLSPLFAAGGPSQYSEWLIMETQGEICCEDSCFQTQISGKLLRLQREQDSTESRSLKNSRISIHFSAPACRFFS